MSSLKKLTYERLKKIAEDFLSQNQDPITFPVPIDEIVEVNLKIKLTALKGLKKNFDIDAFTNAAGDEIYIDNDCFIKYEERCRFSLAHEIGHKVLHEEIYSERKISTPDEFIIFQEQIGDEEYGWLEYQANVFAGCLLVPSNKLKEEVDIAIGEKEKINKEAEFIIPYLDKLPGIFGVSSAVIIQRIKKDNLYDRL